MKIIVFSLLLFLFIENAASQKKSTPSNRENTPASKTTTIKSKMRAATSPAKSTPFVTGVHPITDGTKTFDTLTPTANRAPATNISKPMVAQDTVFNANVINAYGGAPLNNNSASAQFGQTNWGDGRGTIGASQWTIPPPITYSFNRDYPKANNATWSRNTNDTTIFSGRYQENGYWVTTDYNDRGERMATATELPLLQPPAAVASFIAQQPAGFKVKSISKLQVQGKKDVYELQNEAGEKMYLSTDGVRIDY